LKPGDPAKARVAAIAGTTMILGALSGFFLGRAPPSDGTDAVARLVEIGIPEAQTIEVRCAGLKVTVQGDFAAIRPNVRDCEIAATGMDGVISRGKLDARAPVVLRCSAREGTLTCSEL